MKKILILSILIAISATSAVIAQTLQPPGMSASPPSSHGEKYTCPMHPEVVSDKPGECPKCGMTLVPMKDKGKRPPVRRSLGQGGTRLRDATARQAPNTQQHTGHAGHATHDANGMAMPEHPPSHGSGGTGEMKTSMQSTINIADPMNRESSGTAWVPDSTPMYGHMMMFGDDMLMLHGGVFPRYTNVSSRRGDDRIDAPNWFMAMYSHPLNENMQLGGRVMMSLDPLTEQGRGYPLLFQSGETWHDRPLHDRQHPHDLFDELSLSYSQKFDLDLSTFLYFGYPGEPALGPPTFMHRLSAMDNPDAPIGHHWQDSTHITFGVATAGLQWSRFGGIKIEGSIFTGREPDEHRYDFDRPEFDSYSGRISWNPTQNLALQVSHGYIRSPEALDPNVNRHRTTASAIYNMPLGPDQNWSNSFVWGKNNDGGQKTQSFLLESNYQRGRDTIYGRWELVEKSGHELVLKPIDQEKIFTVNALSAGYVHDFSHGDKIDIGLGGQFTLNFWPGGLDPYYGEDGVGYGFQVFLRIRPSLHGHGGPGHSQHVQGMEK